MRDGTRSENATRWCGAIEMDVNEDSVAPWNGHVGGGDGLEDGRCWYAEDDVDDDEGGAGSRCFGMKDVTTATGCAVSRRSARILWESSRVLLCWFARSEEDQRLAVASASAERDMGLNSLSDSEGEMGPARCLDLLGSTPTPFLTDNISMIT